jgi:ribonuclease HI
MLTIYTDGACSGNGKTSATGGYGVVVLDDMNYVVEARSKHCDETTTNNREELKAILYAMLKYGSKTNPPTVYSDSAYAVNTLTQWMFGWERKGWVKSDNKTPENLDLIKPYFDRVKEGYKIDLVKVKGHSGVQWNEVADKLATGSVTGEDIMSKYGR